jgi:hypothetical protein
VAPHGHLKVRLSPKEKPNSTQKGSRSKAAYTGYIFGLIKGEIPRRLFDKVGFRFLNLILSHQHSDLMLDSDRRRKFSSGFLGIHLTTTATTTNRKAARLASASAHNLCIAPKY